jgi:hypothetical protein
VGVLFRGLSAEFLFTFEERANLGLPETTMATRSTDTADSSGSGPSGHSLRVDAKQRSHLAGREQTISSVHIPLLASTKGVVPARAGRRAVGGTYSHYNTVETRCPTNHDSIRPEGFGEENAPPAHGKRTVTGALLRC